MQFKDEIVEWITGTLSTPSPIFNNLPACPYAKKAYTDNKIIFHKLQNYDHITIAENIKAEIENYSYHWPKDVDVVVIGTEAELIDPIDLTNTVELCNNSFLKNRGYTALEDHPDEIEQVEGFILNQGTYALVLLQSTQKLKDARDNLKSKDYYKNWNKDYLEDVLSR